MFSLILIWGNYMTVMIKSHCFNIINKYIPLGLYFIKLFISIFTLGDEKKNSPPKPHAFVSIPLQSGISLLILNISSSLLFFILFLNFILFYLDEFRLSQNKLIKFLQILTPIWLLLIVFIFFYLNILTFNNVLFLDEDKTINNTVSIGGSVEMNRDAAEVIGRNIGIAGTVAGVSGAVGKAIAKSSMPPLQKAAVVVGAGIAGGAIHVGTSVINRVVNTPSSSTTTSITSNLPDGVNKLVADSGNGYSDLMLLILSIDTLTCVCLSLIFILFMMILFKFYLNEEKVKFHLSSLGDKMNNNLNYYLIKLIHLNKKTSTVYIFIIFIILFISLAFNCYFITELYNNLDKFVDLHINSRK